jgi:HSP20 family molecular chaperone IbpA
MSRIPLLSSPLLLGFDEIERVLERVTKASTDGYPPYNIEKFSVETAGGERLQIVLAVAGFTRDQLDITVEDSQLTIRGRQDEARETKGRVFLHRGIAARQFQRTFVLADGCEVRRADLDNGLLTIDIARPDQAKLVRRIDIAVRK